MSPGFGSIEDYMRNQTELENMKQQLALMQ